MSDYCPFALFEQNIFYTKFKGMNRIFSVTLKFHYFCAISLTKLSWSQLRDKKTPQFSVSSLKNSFRFSAISTMVQR